MRLRFPTLALGLLLFIALPRVNFGEDLKADTETGKKLLAEGDELADQAKTTDAVLQYSAPLNSSCPACASYRSSTR